MLQLNVGRLWIWILLILIVGTLFAGILVVGWLIRPMAFPPLISTPHPATSYEEAIKQFEMLQAEEAKLPLHQGGRSILLTHGHPTDQVFVLLHGFTNSPRQFLKLGQMLFDRGVNVVIPRLAYHGLANRMTEAHAALTADDMIHQANIGIDMAQGLGRQITVVGLSISGASTAWIIRHRNDVDTACLLAPFLGLPGVPDGATPTAMRLLLRLPNKVMWWDPRVREKIEGPATNYPRYATHPLAETLRLGVDADNSKDPLKVKRLILVLSESDIAINNARARRMVNQWCRESPETQCAIHIFPAADKVVHDFIDPEQSGAQIEKVYPQLLQWLLPSEKQ